MTHEDLDNLQAGLGNLSNTKMKGLANWHRVKHGRHSIPADYTKHLTDKSNELRDLYHQEQVDLALEGDIIESRPVIYADCKEAVERICKERNYVGTPNVIIMIDGGGGFFKVVATILPENYDWETDSVVDPDEGSNPIDLGTTSTRSTYAEGGSLKKGKLSGVNRVVVLALTPHIKETNANFRKLFDLININSIDYHMVSDYKAMLLALGLQTASSTYPCAYCFAILKFLDVVKEERTFEDLVKDFQKFTTQMKGDKKCAKFCHSTVNHCLLKADPFMKVLEKYILPELHSILGFTNHLVFKGLQPLLGLNRTLLWPKKLNQVAKGYFDTTLEGPACRVLLKNSSVLLDPEILGDLPETSVQPFIRAVDCFNDIVASCFGTDPVDIPEVEQLVTKFGEVYKETGLSVTPKIHSILFHLVDTLKLPYLQGRGLGVCTEQAGESFHSHFKDKFWSKWKVSSPSHPNYAKHLFNAVVECASKAI